MNRSTMNAPASDVIGSFKANIDLLHRDARKVKAVKDAMKHGGHPDRDERSLLRLHNRLGLRGGNVFAQLVPKLPAFCLGIIPNRKPAAGVNLGSLAAAEAMNDAEILALFAELNRDLRRRSAADLPDELIREEFVRRRLSC